MKMESKDLFKHFETYFKVFKTQVEKAKAATSLAKRVALLEQSTDSLDLIKDLERCKKTIRKVGRPKKGE